VNKGGAAGTRPLTPTLPARQDQVHAGPSSSENPGKQGLEALERTYGIRSERSRTPTLATNLATRVFNSSTCSVILNRQMDRTPQEAQCSPSGWSDWRTSA
jgi:hypothetical protein